MAGWLLSFNPFAPASQETAGSSTFAGWLPPNVDPPGGPLPPRQGYVREMLQVREWVARNFNMYRRAFSAFAGMVIWSVHFQTLTVESGHTWAAAAPTAAQVQQAVALVSNAVVANQPIPIPPRRASTATYVNSEIRYYTLETWLGTQEQINTMLADDTLQVPFRCACVRYEDVGGVQQPIDPATLGHPTAAGVGSGTGTRLSFWEYIFDLHNNGSPVDPVQALARGIAQMVQISAWVEHTYSRLTGLQTAVRSLYPNPAQNQEYRLFYRRYRQLRRVTALARRRDLHGQHVGWDGAGNVVDGLFGSMSIRDVPGGVPAHIGAVYSYVSTHLNALLSVVRAMAMPLQQTPTRTTIPNPRDFPDSVGPDILPRHTTPERWVDGTLPGNFEAETIITAFLLCLVYGHNRNYQFNNNPGPT